MRSIPIETLNRCGVGAKGDRIVLLLPDNVQNLTGPQACELAAWLVCIADVSCALPEFDSDEHFQRAVSAIRNA